MENKKISKEDVLEFLRKERLATISTVTPEGKPDGAAIYYIAKDNLEIVFLTKKNTGKFTNMLQDKDVVLTITNEELQHTVKIRGEAVILENSAAAVIEVITTLAHNKEFILNLDKVLPLAKKQAGEVVAVRVEPKEIRMSMYNLEKLAEETFFV